MKKTFVVALVVVLTLFAVGCEKTEEARAREENKRVQRLQNLVNSVVGNIRYTKDTRTGLCFAFYHNGHNTEMSIAMVPCEAVPPQLLTVSNLYSTKKD